MTTTTVSNAQRQPQRTGRTWAARRVPPCGPWLLAGPRSGCYIGRQRDSEDATTAKVVPRVRLDVEQDGRNAHGAEHAPVIYRLPALAFPLFARRRRLETGAGTSEVARPVGQLSSAHLFAEEVASWLIVGRCAVRREALAARAAGQRGAARCYRVCARRQAKPWHRVGSGDEIVGREKGAGRTTYPSGSAFSDSRTDRCTK